MNFSRFTLQKDDAGRRLDRLLRKFLYKEPLSLIHKSIRSGIIRINGKKTEAAYRINEGDILEIALCLSTGIPKSVQTPASALRTKAYADVKKNGSALYEGHLFTDIFINEHIRIINKAYGVPVQGGNPRLISADEAVKKQYAEKIAAQKDRPPPLAFTPGPLHRIDRRTSGLTAFSQSLRGAQWFSANIAAGSIQKEYLALLQGALTEVLDLEHLIERGGKTEKNIDFTHALPTAHGNNGRFKTVGVSDSDTKKQRGKRALTRIEPLAQTSIESSGFTVTLARVRIQTGRTHQIRAQSAFCGFPLAGDTAYGAAAFRFPETKNGQSLFLHAHTLIFPEDNPLELPHILKAPVNDFFRQFIEKHLPAVDLSTYT